MSKIKVLIIGYGSIGRKYHRILKKIKEIDDVVIFTSQKKILNSIDSVSDLKKINPDIIIISSTSNTHYKYLKIVNSIYKNKRILVEKPLFIKLEKLEHLNNKIFVGYNLRFLPVIKFLKKYLKKKKLFLQQYIVVLISQAGEKEILIKLLLMIKKLVEAFY